MKEKYIMRSGDLLNPYTETRIERGKKVTCRMTSSGITICDREKKSYKLPIFITILGIIFLTILLCLKIDIIFTDGSSTHFAPSGALRDIGIVIAIGSIFVGIFLGILYTTKKYKK